MPPPPRSPLEELFDNLESAAQEAVSSFISDLANRGREHIRQAARSIPPPPSPRPQRRGANRSRQSRAPRPSPTLYDTLEVSPKASHETISAAFRSLSSRYHPDNSETGNSERYKLITAAWAVLKNEDTRRKYDQAAGIG